MLHTIRITPDWFNHLRSFKEFQELLCDLDIADEDQLDLFDTLDVDGSGTIDLEELVVGICKLRGDARRSDIVGVGLVVRNIQMALVTMEQTLMDRISNLANAMEVLTLHTGQTPCPRFSSEKSCSFEPKARLVRGRSAATL